MKNWRFHHHHSFNLSLMVSTLTKEYVSAKAWWYWGLSWWTPFFGAYLYFNTEGFRKHHQRKHQKFAAMAGWRVCCIGPFQFLFWWGSKALAGQCEAGLAATRTTIKHYRRGTWYGDPKRDFYSPNQIRALEAEAQVHITKEQGA